MVGPGLTVSRATWVGGLLGTRPFYNGWFSHSNGASRPVSGELARLSKTVFPKPQRFNRHRQRVFANPNGGQRPNNVRAKLGAKNVFRRKKKTGKRPQNPNGGSKASSFAQTQSHLYKTNFPEKTHGANGRNGVALQKLPTPGATGNNTTERLEPRTSIPEFGVGPKVSGPLPVTITGVQSYGANVSRARRVSRFNPEAPGPGQPRGLGSRGRIPGGENPPIGGPGGHGGRDAGLKLSQPRKHVLETGVSPRKPRGGPFFSPKRALRHTRGPKTQGKARNPAVRPRLKSAHTGASAMSEARRRGAKCY